MTRARVIEAAHAEAPRRTVAPQARETADVQRYLRALFDGYEPGALIEVRSRYRGGMRAAFFAATDTFTAARTIVREGLRTDVYVGVAARRRRAGGKQAIEEIRTLWADIDTADARAALEALPVAPAIVIASGTAGHLHAYWLLARPVAIAAAESANRRLAAQLHADSGAVTNAATILRPLSVGEALGGGCLPACSCADASSSDRGGSDGR